MHCFTHIRSLLFAIPLTTSLLLAGSTSVFADDSQTASSSSEYQDQLLLAHCDDFDDRLMLYDRNDNLRHQQRQRRQAYNRMHHTGRDYGYQGDSWWEQQHEGENPMYYEPEEHPDVVGD